MRNRGRYSVYIWNSWFVKIWLRVVNWLCSNCSSIAVIKCMECWRICWYWMVRLCTWLKNSWGYSSILTMCCIRVGTICWRMSCWLLMYWIRVSWHWRIHRINSHCMIWVCWRRIYVGYLQRLHWLRSCHTRRGNKCYRKWNWALLLIVIRS